MNFPLNISNEDFIINNAHHSLTDDDIVYIQKVHPIFFNDNLGQVSPNGWSHQPIQTGISDHYHQNPIPLIPNQNYDPLNQFTTQNLLVYNLPIAEIPSKYQFMGIDSYSRTDNSEESMNNIANNNINFMTYNTAISVEPKGILDIFHDFHGNTMWDDTIQNKGLITSGYGPALDNFIVESHPIDLLVHEDIKSTTREVIGRHQGTVMIQIDQEKNKKVVKRNKPMKKSNIITGKWTFLEDKKLREMVELYGTKKWGMIAKMVGWRVGKQCRERWHNHLRPNIKIDAWTEEEDQILVEAHKVVGNKWTKIARQLPGRSKNAIKNHWNSTIRRMHLMKTKQNGENANPPHNNILEDYIGDVTINNDSPNAIEIAGITENTKDDYECEDIYDEEMNLSLGVRTQSTEPVVDESTTSFYVPEAAKFPWDNYIAGLCESMDDPQMLMQG